MILVLALTWLVMMNLSEGCTRDNPTWSDQPNKSGRTFGLSGNKFLVSVSKFKGQSIRDKFFSFGQISHCQEQM